MKDSLFGHLGFAKNRFYKSNSYLLSNYDNDPYDIIETHKKLKKFVFLQFQVFLSLFLSIPF